MLLRLFVIFWMSKPRCGRNVLWHEYANCDVKSFDLSCVESRWPVVRVALVLSLMSVPPDHFQLLLNSTYNSNILHLLRVRPWHHMKWLPSI